MKKPALLLLMLVLRLVAVSAQDSLLINEVMQSNVTTLMVEKDFPDSWLELYNPTNQPININRYAVGEHNDMARAYRFDVNTIIPAHGHLLILCDKKNQALHTDFRIDAGKDTLRLFSPQGNIIDEVALAEMPATDLAYGRVSDGAEEWYYEFMPTPETVNEGGGSMTVLPEPIVESDGSVANEIQQVRMTLPEGVPEDCGIYYTTDGTVPTLSSKVMKELVMSFSKTRIIRARVMSRGKYAIPSEVVTRSYLFHPREMTMPIVSLVTNDDYLNSNDIGILSRTVNDGVPNYMQKWRRPVNIEVFDNNADGQTVINQQAEIAVSGVTTREEIQKSLKVYANKRFGKKKLSALWTDDKPEVEKVKSMILRNGGNNCFTTRINDAWVQRLFGRHLPVGMLDWQAYRPAVVYVNGHYKGEYALRERSDEDYVEANYPEVGDIEMADNDAYINRNARGPLFQQFHAAYTNNNTTYAQMEALMDVDNFIATLIAEMYAKNTDYPTNNVSMWRPVEEGGRWRWILKDIDRAGVATTLCPHSFDMIDYMFTPSSIYTFKDESFQLYQHMIAYPEFRDRFIDMFTVCLGDFLRPDVAQALLDEMEAEVHDEMRQTFAYYGKNFTDFTQNMIFLRNFIKARRDYLYNQLAAYFSLGKQCPLTITAGECRVLVNEMPLTEGDFSGQCFSSRAVRLSSEDVEGWRITTRYAEGTDVQEVMMPDYSLVAPESALDITVEAIKKDVSDPEDGVLTPVIDNREEIFDVQGVRHSRLVRGVNIVRRGSVTKTILSSFRR